MNEIRRMKVCPSCGTALFADAMECKLCGYRFPVPAAPVVEPPVVHLPRQRSKPRFSPLVISLFGLVGGGQVANHQIVKGAVLFAVSIALLFAPSLVPSIVIYLLAALDAHLVSQRRDRGEPVGDWDWF